jgi:hypothetical protein
MEVIMMIMNKKRRADDSVGRRKGRDSVDFGRLPPGSDQYGQ